MNTWIGLVVLAAALTSATLVDKPVTVVVAVPKTARRAQALLLQLEQVIRPKGIPVTFNIFVNMPSANLRTSVDDPHFVGYVTALANPNAGAKPVGFTIQVADPAARLIKTMAMVRFTFIPTEHLPEGGLKIGAIRLEPVK